MGRGGAAVALVVNGDDFGYDDAINAAIVRCHREGALTSATLLVNRPASAAALALARQSPALGLGLHLNLTEGCPVAPPDEVASLLDRRGRFRPFPAQLGRVVSGRARPEEIERELGAQFAWLAARGVRPTHVDGHHHVHAYPGVLPVVLRLMAEYDVRALRSPLLTAWLPLSLARPGARGWRAALLARRGVARADALLDAGLLTRRADPVGATVRAVAGSGAGVVELMAHPAWNRDADAGAAQVRLLTDPRLRPALARADVRLVRYDDVAAG